MLKKADFILNKAKKEGYSVPAFNVLNQEMIKGVVQAAEEKNHPIIIQLTASAIKWAGFDLIAPMVISAAEKAKVDIAVHLDHCSDINFCKKAVDFGFSSIMYDGSHLDVEENIKNSNIVREYIDGRASLELELGKVGGKEDGVTTEEGKDLTPEEAIDFYNKTKPDFFAIAFGTAHGVYKGEINLDYDLLQKSAKEIPVPLVMHGTSGVPKDQIVKSIKSGAVKINVGTDLLIAMNKALRKSLDENKDAYDIRVLYNPAIEAVKDKAIDYINICKS